MANSGRNTKHPRSRHNGSRSRAPRPNPHKVSIHNKPTTESDISQERLLHVLAALSRKVERIEQLIVERRRTESRWLSPAQAAKQMGISADNVRIAIKQAVDAGDDVIFDRFHIQKFGQGEERPRYRIWEADIVGAQSA